LKQLAEDSKLGKIEKFDFNSFVPEGDLESFFTDDIPIEGSKEENSEDEPEKTPIEKREDSKKGNPYLEEEEEYPTEVVSKAPIEKEKKKGKFKKCKRKSKPASRRRRRLS